MTNDSGAAGPIRASRSFPSPRVGPGEAWLRISTSFLVMDATPKLESVKVEGNNEVAKGRVSKINAKRILVVMKKSPRNKIPKDNPAIQIRQLRKQHGFIVFFLIAMFTLSTWMLMMNTWMTYESTHCYANTNETKSLLCIPKNSVRDKILKTNSNIIFENMLLKTCASLKEIEKMLEQLGNKQSIPNEQFKLKENITFLCNDILKKINPFELSKDAKI